MRGRQQQRVRGGERQAMSPRRAAWVDTPSTERRPKAGGLAAQGWTPATWDHRTPPSTPSTCHITCVDPSGGHRCIDTHRIRSLAEACTHKDKRHPPAASNPSLGSPSPRTDRKNLGGLGDPIQFTRRQSSRKETKSDACVCHLQHTSWPSHMFPPRKIIINA